MLNGENGFEVMKVGDDELFIAFSPVKSSGWSLGSVVPAADVLQTVTALERDMREATRNVLLQRVVPISILISLALLLVTILLTNRLVNPIRLLAKEAEQFGAGKRNLQIPDQRSDEIGLLARTLNRMSAQINKSFEQLEARVAERTHQLEKRTHQLETAAEIASDITIAEDLQTLLKQAVTLIQERFSYYYIGIFLLDETGETAFLRAASGEQGEKLLLRGVRLRVGQQGIVGYVTQFGQARIAGDVQKDEAYLADPLLPDARSEAVIPLLTSGRTRSSGNPEPRVVLGALDVQSTEPDAFSAADLSVLQVLADQLAVAIQNTRLVDQLQKTLDELSNFTQLGVEEAWRRFSSRSGDMAYEYDRLEIKSAHPFSSLPASDEAPIAVSYQLGCTSR